jgi:hypothetical protein
MKSNREATHNHKRIGAVAILESTTELARIVVTLSGDEFWVKQIDLTPVGAIDESKAGKKRVKANHAKPAVHAA